MLPTPSAANPSKVHVQEFCHAVCANDAPFYVPVSPDLEAIERECFPNIQRKIAVQGGQIVYGRAIWQCGTFFIEAEHHAVYRTPEGCLIDITPQEPPIPQILFLPDERMIHDPNTTKVVDNYRKALRSYPKLLRLLDLFAQRTVIMNAIPSIGGQVTLTGEDARRFMAVERDCRSFHSVVISIRRNTQCPNG